MRASLPCDYHGDAESVAASRESTVIFQELLTLMNKVGDAPPRSAIDPKLPDATVGLQATQAREFRNAK
jgi:hypothetical protein